MPYLSTNDIIYLPKGMEVYNPEMPEYYYKNKHPYSKKVTTGSFIIGSPRRRLSHEQPLQDEIKKLISFAFAYHELPLDKGILSRFVGHQVPNCTDNEMTIPAGNYLVTKVEVSEGMRTVYCTSHPTGELTIYFYQEHKNFTTYKDVQVVGKVGSPTGE